ncbi:protein ITPRID1 isoform X3 [Oryctolagus cuniculus]|uniref:protein ITPRID1 isoform X3 n=1 Tax=Oryctolagus cuniculus TaxID=9986 RepID=UPI0004902386
MAEMSQGPDKPQEGQEKSKRKILRLTKKAWVPLEEQPFSDPRKEGETPTIPLVEDSKQENTQQWLDSGFFVSADDNVQRVIGHTDLCISFQKLPACPEGLVSALAILLQVYHKASLNGWNFGKEIQWRFSWIWALVLMNQTSVHKSQPDSWIVAQWPEGSTPMFSLRLKSNGFLLRIPAYVVQSFEEDTGNALDRTPGTIGVWVGRANSCQSDSSGFLEEPPEPLPLQMPSLPSSQSPAENPGSKPGGGSHSFGFSQDWQPEADGSDPKSAVSTPAPSQSWSVLEEKGSDSVVGEESQLEAIQEPMGHLTPDLALAQTSHGGAHLREDGRVPPPPACPGYEDIEPLVTSMNDPLGFTMTHTTGEGKDEFLRPSGAGTVHMQNAHSQESLRAPRNDHVEDKLLQLDAKAPEGEDKSRRHPDTSNGLLAGHSPPWRESRVPEQSKVTPGTADRIPMSAESIPHLETPPGDANQAKPRCRALGQRPPGAEGEVEKLPTNADANTSSCRSVTIQMSSSLLSAAWSTVALGTDCRGTASDHAVCDSATTRGSRLRTEERRSRDVSVQTDFSEPRPWHCCAALRREALTHGLQPLTRSVSLDTGFPCAYPVGTCLAAPAHGCVCGPHHPHCCWEKQSCSPAPPACGHCLCSQAAGHLDAHTAALKILQDTPVRELCSFTVQEMEAMKMVCRGFREHLEEIEQHLTGQQALFYRHMSEEEREEAAQLQTLRETLRQQVAELEFQLGDRARQVREGILLQLELLTGEPPERCTNLPHWTWMEGNNGQTSCAELHPAMTARATIPPNSGQQAPSSGCLFMDGFDNLEDGF